LEETEKATKVKRVPAGVYLAMIHRICHNEQWIAGVGDPRPEWIDTLYQRYRKAYPKRTHTQDEMPLLVMLSALRRVRRKNGVRQAVVMFEEYRNFKDVTGKLVNQPSQVGMLHYSVFFSLFCSRFTSYSTSFLFPHLAYK
jgi:hypothetical protein